MSESATVGRVVALDLGSRRIGVAVCDSGRTVATPYETVRRVGDRPVEHAELLRILEETGATLVVVGLPLSLDGSIGPTARAVQSEVRAMQRNFPVPVKTHDERLTTVTAEEYLDDQGVHGSRRKEMVDQIAAAIILQSWLDGSKG